MIVSRIVAIGMIFVLGQGRPVSVLAPEKLPLLVELKINHIELRKDKLLVQYRLVNSGKTVVYFACPEPMCSSGNWPKVPFVEFDSNRAVLSIASYIASAPKDRELEALYLHVLKKLEPGETRSTIELSLPLQAALPYPTHSSSVVDMKVIKGIQLTLGILPCPNASLPPFGEGGGLFAADFSLRIRCGTAEGGVASFQQLVTAEEPYAFSRSGLKEPTTGPQKDGG
jgi:hypothetical protein